MDFDYTLLVPGAAVLGLMALLLLIGGWVASKIAE